MSLSELFVEYVICLFGILAYYCNPPSLHENSYKSKVTDTTRTSSTRCTGGHVLALAPLNQPNRRDIKLPIFGASNNANVWQL